MAKNTDLSLRNQLIYQVYVRNHTAEGTFRALEGDLPRISGRRWRVEAGRVIRE